MFLYLDIETVRNTNSRPELIESIRRGIKPDGRATDKEKSKMSKFADLMDDSALYPLLNQIIVIGGAINDNSSFVFTSKNEDELLKGFTAYLLTDYRRIVNEGSSRVGRTLVTFNGQSFDLPNLRIKLAKYNIPTPFIFNPKKYDLDNHFDVRQVLTNFDQFGRGTLDQWGLFFGFQVDESISGSDIGNLWENGEIETIIKKNRKDVELLRAIHLKLINYF